MFSLQQPHCEHSRLDYRQHQAYVCGRKETSPEFILSTHNSRLDTSSKLFDLCRLHLFSCGHGLWTGIGPHITYWGRKEITARRRYRLIVHSVVSQVPGELWLHVMMNVKLQILSMKTPVVPIHQLLSRDQRPHSLSTWQAEPLPFDSMGWPRDGSRYC